MLLVLLCVVRFTFYWISKLTSSVLLNCNTGSTWELALLVASASVLLLGREVARCESWRCQQVYYEGLSYYAYFLGQDRRVQERLSPDFAPLSD